MLESKYFAHVSAVFTVIIWGTTFVSTKVLLNSFTPIEILFIRFCIGFLALFLFYPKRLQPKNRSERLYFMGAGLTGVTLYFLFENIALNYSLASNIGVIVSTAPFFTAILSHFLIKDIKIHRNFMIGFVFAIIGIALISFQGSDNIEVNPIGDFLAVLSAMVWACYSILMRKISTFHYPTVQSTRIIFFYGLLFMIPCLFFMDFSPTLEQFKDPINLFNLIYLGLGASAICFVSWNYTIKVLGAIRSSAYIYLVPVVTVLFSWIILDEPISSSILIGSALTLFGLFISERRKT